MHSSPRQVWSHKTSQSLGHEEQKGDERGGIGMCEAKGSFLFFFLLLTKSISIDFFLISLNKIQKGQKIVKCRIGAY